MGFKVTVMRKITILCLCVLNTFLLHATQRQFVLTSPDKKLQATINVGELLTYSISCNGHPILDTSPISMTLSNGEVWGKNAILTSTSKEEVNQMISSPFYRATEIKEHYNKLLLRFQKGWNVEFRAYNDGIAYRFISKQKKPFNVIDEAVNFCFTSDVTASVPYVNGGNDGDYKSQYFNSFENTYTTDRLSRINTKHLTFLPLVVETDDGIKICITESGLENYPGLYLLAVEGENRLKGHFALYPKKMEQGGYNQLQMMVTEREVYIAKVNSPREFPWRISIVATSDKALAASNLSYLLGFPSRLHDISWIKPGKVAWDWWNDWTLSGVDFVSGINNPTYKAYIDFASSNNIEYVILDEGWSVNLQADLMQVVKEIDLKELIDYAASKNVGIILWAGFYAFERDMENVCRHYANMGVKGFKVDFLDRDDQLMTNFCYRAAQMCAKYKLILNLHGTHKPAGLNRTYPNVLNFEGVHGLEQMKWRPSSTDQVKYDIMLPFIRQVSGPMDYTQGAMRNAVKGNYHPCNSAPMSQGTRCRQLALYIIFESPLNMLCDTPSNYMREAESTDFIADIPTVWDETIVLDGKMGEYIVTARRSGKTWYVGGITDWTARDIEVDCSFLDDKIHEAILFKDGINAHRVGTDYKREPLRVGNDSKLKIHLAPGGGFTLKVF